MSIGERLEGVSGAIAGGVTSHNRLVIVVMLVLTAGVVAGLAQDQGETTNEGVEDVIEGTEVQAAGEYLETAYFDDQAESPTPLEVYFRSDERSVLSKPGLLAALEYHRTVLESEAVTDSLTAEGIRSPATIVASGLTDESDPDLATQREALSAASPSEVATAVEATFTGGEQTRQLLPVNYEPGTAEASAMRLTLSLDGEPGQAVTDATTDAAAQVDDRTPVTAFTSDGLNQQLQGSVLPELGWLVVPLILLVLVVVLGFAYRDVTDVLVSLVGVVVTMLWAFGLMGWLGLFNQQTGLIVPVLAIALSIDFSFHSFMRYRERRGPEDGIREGLKRSSAAVMIAFLLVTVTAVIGFLPNLTNPIELVRELSVALILAVIAAFVVFTTLVPALKVSADGLWERFGFDRTGTALGTGSYLASVLGSGATVARRASVAVIAVALLLGVVGGVAFTDLDRQQFQESDLFSDPGWQSELPGPMAYELHETEAAQQLSFVSERFGASQTDADDTTGFTQFLLRGEVTTPETMQALATAEDAAAAADPEVVLNQGGVVDVRSPLTAMQRVAAENPDSDFATTFAASAGSETTDPAELRTLVPESDIEAVLDAFYEAAPAQAGGLIERTEEGYASARVLVPVQNEFGDERAAAMFEIEDAIAETADTSVTAVGSGTLNQAFLEEIVDGITTTMVLALGGIFLVLAVVYRAAYGSATLGLVTGLPIALVLGLVFAGMWLLGEPLTPNTALIVSIAIGLGIDYNIHVSDRFATERKRGADTTEALAAATTGTGGALLGSAVTSAGAFALLIVTPLALFESIGTLVALTLAAAFLLSVFVLPSLLYRWANLVDARDDTVAESPAPSD